jgi:AraC family transcriptional regulator of adaptative response / DNA-3-methyladenine glycosylase II
MRPLPILKAVPDVNLPRRDVASNRPGAGGGQLLDLRYHEPLAYDIMLDYLAGRAIPGVEHVSGGTYRRTVNVGGKPGLLELSRGPGGALLLRTHTLDPDRLAQRARRILNLDATADGAAHLAGDPLVGPLIRARPGLRAPGTWDAYETGVRAIVGQQVSVAAASTVTGRIVARHGVPMPGPARPGLTHLFPPPQALAEADLAGLGMPASRARAIGTFARAVAEGALVLDGEQPLADFVASVTALPGLGDWTAQYLALRLGHPDAFPASDLGLRRAVAARTGEALRAVRPEQQARPWRPHRALAAVHLWFSESAPSLG